MAYFRSFDVVVSALDNLETRRYVNRMCVAADVPLVESGTTGFFGQVQPIRARHTECYDCTAHPTPTSYPVCTIRSTPSTPVHCIVWAKSWLFPQLFGAEEEVEADEQELDSAAQSGEDANELANLRAEARQMRTLRAALLDAARRGEADEAHAERLFNKLYDVDIRRLLSMEDMWRHRASRPAPLTLADAHKAQGGSATHTLRDQQQLSVADTAALFLESLQALAARAVQSDAPIAFDKDDDEVLGFVTAAANLRAHVYHIPEKTRFETKQIAGNIIPAIATTNAVVSGLVVVQALHMLAQHWDRLRMVSIARRATRVFTTFPTGAPNPGCAVCHDVYVEVHADVERATLGDVLAAARRERTAGGLGLPEEQDISIAQGARILYDMDLEENLEKRLAQLGVQPGATLSLVDEDGQLATVQLLLAAAPAEGPPLALPQKLPELARRPKVEPAPAPASDDEAPVEVAPPPKRAAPDEAGARKRRAPEDAAPAKRARQEGTAEAAIVLE